MSKSPVSTRRARRAPSCRNGASSLLRLAQPLGPRSSAAHGMDMSSWLARAASALAPAGSHPVHVSPTEFAPSQWLIGH